MCVCVCVCEDGLSYLPLSIMVHQLEAIDRIILFIHLSHFDCLLY